MKKCCLLLVVLLSCSLLLAPMAFAEQPEVVTMTQDEFGRLQLAKAVTPRYQICCTNGPALAWRTTSVLHIYLAGGGICQGVNYVGDQYCQLCGHVWQANTIYKSTPGCGLYHY